MTPSLRQAGVPSPLVDGTHDDEGLPLPIVFDPAVAGSPEFVGSLDSPDLGEGAPDWMTAAARMIRPLSVGALMAIPTLGAASVGLVAMIDEQRGMAMARASVAFLTGLPTDIVVLIGTLATGYGVARTVEKLRRS